MKDFESYRTSAIRYWEWRRIWYNLALVPPAFLGFSWSEFSVAIGDITRLGLEVVLFLFFLSAVGANLCYSVAYGLEFIFGNDSPNSAWTRFWRGLFFLMGTLFGVVLAFVGGRNIANLRDSGF